VAYRFPHHRLELAMATVELTAANFDEVASRDGIVLVDVGAAGCGHCRQYAPVFERSSQKHTDIVFGKVDTDTEQELAMRYGIRSIPTIMAIRDGVIVFAQPGALPENLLEKLIEQVRALDMDEVRRKLAEQQSGATGRAGTTSRSSPRPRRSCPGTASAARRDPVVDRCTIGGMRWANLAVTPVPATEPSRSGTARAPTLPLADAVVRRFHTPGFAGMTFYEVRAKSPINRVPAASRVPFEWTINPYRGCSHACVYCFARRTHTYLDLDAGEDFDRRIVVKVNAGELLRRELAHPRWRGDHI